MKRHCESENLYKHLVGDLLTVPEGETTATVVGSVAAGRQPGTGEGAESLHLIQRLEAGERTTWELHKLLKPQSPPSGMNPQQGHTS